MRACLADQSGKQRAASSHRLCKHKLRNHPQRPVAQSIVEWGGLQCARVGTWPDRSQRIRIEVNVRAFQQRNLFSIELRLERRDGRTNARRRVVVGS